MFNVYSGLHSHGGVNLAPVNGWKSYLDITEMFLILIPIYYRGFRDKLLKLTKYPNPVSVYIFSWMPVVSLLLAIDVFSADQKLFVCTQIVFWITCFILIF